MRATIIVPNVDVGLLRKQRDTCLYILDEVEKYSDRAHKENLNGLINMLDDMLDIAEGHK